MKGAAARRLRGRALVILFVWLLGFELGPSVHIGFHDLFGHHHHGGAPHHAHDANEGSHSHQAARHNHRHDSHRLTDVDETDADSRNGEHGHGHSHGDPGHGAGSVAHKGLAILGAPPPPIIAAPVIVELYPAPDFQRTFVSKPPARPKRARGPPHC